ncbi:MAG: hypothetical protein GF372_11395 [Candidatus Marinimicrobia bacterium]|nr:hypothetical protein [Candidatus Neomarinimicrobiota bacterium]
MHVSVVMLRRQLIYICFALCLIVPAGSVSAPLPEVIFTQYPAGAAEAQSPNRPYFLPVDKYVNGARIVRLTPGNEKRSVTNLTPDFVSACDPDVSFDGETIVFAGKQDQGDTWQIWRMNADGSEKTQLTDEPGNCVAPVHAGARFFLDDPEPVIQIIYAGDSHGWKNELNDHPASSIYAVDITGDRIHRLSFNLNADYEPAVLPNGRIIYSSWQRYGDRFGHDGLTALLAINNDGTDLMPFYGNHQGPDYKSMASVSPDGNVYFIESGSPGYLGGGSLAMVGKSRPLHSYKNVRSDGLYTAPSAQPDSSLFVSYRQKNSSAPYAIYQVDPENFERENRFYSAPDWHSLDVQCLMPRPEPQGRSNWLIPGTETGVYYALDAYRSNVQEYQNFTQGTLKFVRVLEGLPQKSAEVDSEKSLSHFAPSRILGVLPLEKDGSFQFTLPANTPVTFQLLDEHRQAVATQHGWTWVMGNESRGCIGCHEDREMAPPNIFVDAVKKEPVNLMLPPERRRSVDFKNTIAPLVHKNCTNSGCHDSQAPVNFRDKNGYKLYETLVQSGAVKPGSARMSPLTWHLLGEAPESAAGVRVPESVSVSENVRIQITEWIDMGALWDVSPYLEN